jgi:type VI secretion system protein ImpJ
MYLGPHHFQVQSRYFEDTVRFLTSALWFEPFGLIGASLDAEALRNGTVSLIHARGVLPDGTAFHMPDADTAPEPRAIADLFPPTRDKVLVHLAIPARKPDGLNCLPVSDAHSGPPTRYWAEPQVIHDETTGRDEKPVQLGRKNMRLILDIEATESDICLPVARVMRDGAGHFIFDPEFIAPCLDIAAAERLMNILRRLVDILDDKCAALSRNKKQTGKSWAEYSTTDVARFWMLHAINSAIPPLRHFFLTRRGHPEALYIEMARLAGALCTFAIDSHPRAIPLYDHLKLDECFALLDSHIRRHLEVIVPTNFVEIQLTRVADYFYEGEIRDQRVLDRAQWLFAVRSEIGEAETILRVPPLVKLCSKLFVPELVKRALPGMALTHLPVPPSAISRRIDWQYFSVSRVGPCWEHIVKTRQVGVYVPGDIPDPRLELLVVLE